VAFYQETQDLALALINANILMTTSNLMVRRRAFDKLGYFSPLRYVHDLDFFLRLVVDGQILRFIDRPLLDYRFHSNNTISEGTANVMAERAIVTAFHLDHLWNQMPLDWERASRSIQILDDSGMTRPVLFCQAYFHRHPSASLENNSILADEAFRGALATCVKAISPLTRLGELEAEVAALRGSTSWRLTAPLRWLRSHLAT
jgi:hypothetical protein